MSNEAQTQTIATSIIHPEDNMETNDPDTNGPEQCVNIVQEFQVDTTEEDVIFIIEKPLEMSTKEQLYGYKLNLKNEEFKTIRDENKELKRIIEELKADSLTEKTALQCTIKNLQSELDQLFCQFTDCNKELATAQQEISCKKDEVADCRNEIATLDKALFKKVEEIGDLEFKLEMAEYERLRTMERVNELQAEVGQNEVMLESERNLIMRGRRDLQCAEMDMAELQRGFDERLGYMQQQAREADHFMELEMKKFQDQLILAQNEISALQQTLTSERKMSLHTTLKQMEKNTTDVGFLLRVLHEYTSKIANCNCVQQIYNSYRTAHPPPPPSPPPPPPPPPAAV